MICAEDENERGNGTIRPKTKVWLDCTTISQCLRIAWERLQFLWRASAETQLI